MEQMAALSPGRAAQPTQANVITFGSFRTGDFYRCSEIARRNQCFNFPITTHAHLFGTAAQEWN
jgi:hypothetical protein